MGDILVKVCVQIVKMTYSRCYTSSHRTTIFHFNIYTLFLLEKNDDLFLLPIDRIITATDNICPPPEKQALEGCYKRRPEEERSKQKGLYLWR